MKAIIFLFAIALLFAGAAALSGCEVARYAAHEAARGRI